MERTVSKYRTEGSYNRKKRSKRVIRRRMNRMTARFITALSILLILFTLSGSIRSFAGSRDKSPAGEKYYSSILIYPGESLDSLSNKHMSSGYQDSETLKREIICINHLSPDTVLKAGDHLIIPKYR